MGLWNSDAKSGPDNLCGTKNSNGCRTRSFYMFYLVRPNTDSKVIVGHRRRSTGNRQIWAEKQPPFPVIRKAVILDASGNPNEKLRNFPFFLRGNACHQRPAIMASYVLCLC